MKDAEEECDRVYFQAKHAMKYLNKLIEENDDFKCNLAYSAEFQIKVGLMQVWLGRCFGMTYCPNAKGIAHETHERADVLQAKYIYVFANAQRELHVLYLFYYLFRCSAALRCVCVCSTVLYVYCMYFM